jgi:tetratricopeptide (TPR) repeat protein
VQVLFELGVLESLLGQSKDALLRFEKALELLESPVHKNVSERKVELKSEELKLRANILNSCGNIHSDLRDFKKAGDYYANALKLREALKDEEGVASSLLNIGVLNLEQEKIENARILFTQSLNIAENKGFPKIVAFALNDLGWVHLSQGNYREALKVYKKSLKVSKGTGDKYAAAIAMTNIGEIFLENGKTWKATKYFQQSIRGMKAIGELQQLCSPLMGLGKIYTSLGRFHEADELLSNALEIAEISGLKIELANTLRSTGELEERKGNYRKAYLFFLRALNLQKSISDLRGEVLTLSELIQLNINLGRMKNTWCYIELCDRVARELGDPMEMAISSYYQGYYHLRIGNFEYASAHLNRSLGISRDIKYRIGVVKNLLRLGELYNMAGDNVKALEIYGEARRETRTYGLEWLYGEVLLNLAEIQYQKEDYAQSFQNIENSLAISRKYLDNLTESRAKNLGALIACEKAKFNTAELYFREAMETLKKLGNKFFLGICMVRYASYRKFIGENDCILILKKAEKLFSYIHANHWLMEIENIQKGCFND